jgi:hypothetical protein
MNKPLNNLNNLIKQNVTTNTTSTTSTTNTNNSKQQNKTVNSQSNGYSGSSVFGIIILVVVILVVLSSSYWLYSYYTTKNFSTSVQTVIMPDVRDASSTMLLSSNTITSSNFSNEYAVSFWVNIQDYNYNYGKEKVIMRRGVAGSGNPEIVLAAKSNDLIVRVKLQGTTSSVSSFEDIPILLNSQPQSVPVSMSDSNNSIMNSSMDSSINSNDLLSNSNIFNKLGSNNVDFPTIQYINNTNNNYGTGYFDLISGNIVSEGFTSEGFTSEGFTNADDALNATVAVIVDLCNIATTYQDPKLADDYITEEDVFFNNIINSLEKSKTTSKTSVDVNTDFISLISATSNSSSTSTSTNLLKQQLTKLDTDMKLLYTFKNVQIDYKTAMNAINTKMTSIKCPLTFDSESEIDGTASFYENMINLFKKVLYSYRNNLSSSIKKSNPEFGNLGSLSASCIVDSNGNTDPTVGTCVVKMIPLQTWVNIVVSVYNQIVDIYIDGQLSSSCVLKGFPSISTSDINLTPDGGFRGKVANIVFFNTAMTVSQAKTTYYAGPIVSESLFSMIPNWVYWGILIIVIIAIIYSFLA